MSQSFFLIYIHGFQSSPQSAKATLLAKAVQSISHVNFVAPRLFFDPEKNVAILEQVISHCGHDRIGLVGSSMGGFYGTILAEKYRLPLVMVNPAVQPYELLKAYLGDVENPYTGETFTFTEAHIAILKKLDVEILSNPDQYLLLSQKGDEVLDYRQAVEKYQKCHQIVEDGGSHGFDQFERHIPAILDFFKI